MSDRSQVVCFDVDDTLVLWGKNHKYGNAICFNNYGSPQWLTPHDNHIQRLKEHDKSGHFVIVWSQGGSEWAEEVVKVLGLTEHVDLVISKPNFYYDDLPSSAWLGLPQFLDREKE